MTTTAPTQPVPTVLTFAELAAKIREASGLETGEIEYLRVPTSVRVPTDVTPETPRGFIEWQQGRPPPGMLGKYYEITAIFVGTVGDRVDDAQPGDTRLYCHPTVALFDDGTPVSFACFVLKIDGKMRQEPMNLEAFVDEVGHEWHALAVARDLVEDDDELDAECPTCKADVSSEDSYCRECGTMLPSPNAPAVTATPRI